MEYVRQWKVGDQTFDNKAEAQRYEAVLTLGAYNSVADMIDNADAVIAVLRPFATPRTRKSGNGEAKAPKGRKAASEAHAVA